MALGHAHPPVRRLFGCGSHNIVRALHANPGVAVVGSRQASSQGVADARWFARELSAAGVTVISGLAQGIDAAAHEGALDGPGLTIAVLGHGLDSIYPPQHASLAERIIDQGGALITEHPAATPALARNFPGRNRIIAALARAVLVIEAAPRSGSLITARHALDMGVDVFAVPGSIHMPQSIGTNHLIREGAQLIQSPEQLLEDLGLALPKARPPSRSGRARHALSRPTSAASHPQKGLSVADAESLRVLAELSFQPTEAAAISQRLGLEGGSVYGCLLILELAGLAARLADGRWLKQAL
jgi:DNA processing protein